MAERQIELTWRCTSCGHKNLGRHLICQSCGGPKDDSEHYEMPADTMAEASVTDPRLVALARAGANWLCGFCGSHARAPDGSCAQCGARQAEARAQHGAPHRARAQPRYTPGFPISLPIALGLAFGIFIVGGIVLALFARRPAQPVALEPSYRDVAARVERASWVHAVHVERFQIVSREGFEEQKPADALEVRAAGERVHHVDKVADGTTFETYTDHESQMVTESYSDQEQCGEDCRSLPETCREECTNNQNGFATCRTVCSGGGQSCTPRYCSVQKTRTVSKSVPVQKTRTVPKFKDVPRMAKWLSWKVWDWAPARTVEKRGAGFETRWPDDSEIALGQDLGKGEKEREKRSASYTIALVGDDGTRHQVVPRDLADYRRYENATVTLRVERYGSVSVVSGPVPRTAPSASAAR